MKIEVIASGRGSITIKTDEDWDEVALLKLIRKATGLANELHPAKGKLEQFGFGEEQ